MIILGREGYRAIDNVIPFLAERLPLLIINELPIISNFFNFMQTMDSLTIA